MTIREGQTGWRECGFQYKTGRTPVEEQARQYFSCLANDGANNSLILSPGEILKLWIYKHEFDHSIGNELRIYTWTR